MAVIDTKPESLSLAEAFRQSEASSRLEGIDPLHHPMYVALKADILAGKMTPEEAIEAGILSIKRNRHEPAA